MTGRRGRRCRKLLDDLKERRGYSHLKEEALDHTMWRARFGPVVRQTSSELPCKADTGMTGNKGGTSLQCMRVTRVGG